MAKKLFHASHFLKSLSRRSPKRYSKLKPVIKSDIYRVKPGKPLEDQRLKKYWKNRKHLFSKIDGNQIYMTPELWFSVTPEDIARFLSQFIKACLPQARCIMDVFCGGGGNSIQFAKVFPRVIGVDNNLEHLYCTAMNSHAYNVDDHLWLRYGSWSRMFAKRNKSWLSKEVIDCIFASPPWGGPQYLKSDLYDLETMLIPMGVTSLLETFKQLSSNIIIFLPKNSNLSQLSQATSRVFGPDVKCKVLYVKQNGFMKGILCMWGDSFMYYQTEDEETRSIQENSNVINIDTDQSDSSEPNSKQPQSSISNVDFYDING